MKGSPTLLLAFLFPAAAASCGAEDPAKKPRFPERAAERVRMVKNQIERRGVRDAAVLRAMRTVPRHRFVPAKAQRSAYADTPLPIERGQTISQPFIVAYMTEQLRVTPKTKALEIGTGSGYQAAVLAEITPHVFTIEIHRKLADTARTRLQSLGYKSVRVKHGDGFHGWAEHAPFDAIIVTCAPARVPPKLVEQLAPGGRMIIPVGGRYSVQKLTLVEKDAKGNVRTRADIPVRFVPLLRGSKK